MEALAREGKIKVVNTLESRLALLSRQVGLWDMCALPYSHLMAVHVHGAVMLAG